MMKWWYASNAMWAAIVAMTIPSSAIAASSAEHQRIIVASSSLCGTIPQVVSSVIALLTS